MRHNHKSFLAIHITRQASYLLASIMVLGLFSCDIEPEQDVPDRQWQLVWSDEFDGEEGSQPDTNNWAYDIGQGMDGWGNQEFQTYTDRPENVYLDGQGNLVIQAIRENFAGASFSSGRIKTQGKFSQTYGRFEARIITPYGPGIWPAFWMLGDNIEEVSWPQCGEIDIMELKGNQPNILYGSVHGPGYSAGNAITASLSLLNDRFDNDYHVFAVEWGEDYMDFFMDDQWYQSLSPEDLPGEWVFNQDFFLLLNVAVGGTFVGFPTAETPFPQQMIVDYVRVYEQIQ
jgi:beta-glucanase (GH16 family)